MTAIYLYSFFVTTDEYLLELLLQLTVSPQCPFQFILILTLLALNLSNVQSYFTNFF